jgi:hypothetical protein
MVTKNRRADLIFHLLFVVTIVTALGFGTATAQSSEPKTVTDFFLLVPDRYMDGVYDRQSRQEMVRNGWLDIVDVKNGYIFYDASDNPSGFEFAIFRRSNGKYLVAYSTGAFYDAEWSKESGNWPTLLLLSYEGGRWRDVTRASLPVAFDKKMVYTLPRRGRSIAAWDERGRKLYTLTWANDRFRLKRAARR